MQIPPPRLRTRAADATIPLAAPTRAQPPVPVAAASLHGAPRMRRSRLRAGLRAAAALGVLWWCLTPWDAQAWVIGAPAVLLGTALAAVLAQPVAHRLSPVGALGFAGLFAVGTVAGAVDVARRALHPRMPLAPGFREFALDLPEGPARVLFANSVTLLPGTLSAEIRGDRLLVHSIDTGAELDAALARLRAAVRRLYRLPAAPEADA